MTEKELEAYLKEVEAYKKKLLKSKTAAMAFLHSTGIYTKTGRLTRPYTDTSPTTMAKVSKK